MKHVFIINPKAGKLNHFEEISNHLKKYDGKLDYEVYETKSHLDAYYYTKQYLENYTEPVRFYSCGGDGTLNEVLNGMADFPNAELACIANGSGNDFVKYYGTVEDFKNIDEMIEANSLNVDVLNVGGKYCLNICNFGFDAWVCDKMIKYKKIPFVSGTLAYDLGVINCLFFKMKHNIRLEVDDKLVFDGWAMLCAISNGICYGGGYYCSPKSKVDDGIADICMIKKVSVFRAAKLIKVYKVGKHIDNPQLSDIVLYTKGKKFKVSSKKPICYVTDGEVMHTKNLEIEILHNKIKFVVPTRLVK